MDARVMTRKLVALAASCWLALSPLYAVAAEVIDGNVPGNSLPQPGNVGAGWTGSAHKVFRMDPSGILRVTEEYPIQLQTEAFLAGSAIPVHAGLKQIGNGWTVHPNGDRVMRVRRVQTGGTGCDPMYLYLYGSDDNVNFYPLMPAAAWVAGSLTLGYTAGDTARVDTLMIRVPSQPTTAEWKITLPAFDTYPGRYLALWARRDSTSGTTVALTVNFEGRYK